MKSENQDSSRLATSEEIHSALKKVTDLVEKILADPAISDEIKAPLRQQLQAIPDKKI